MPTSTTPLRILLVDDNPDNLALMRLFLENVDARIETAVNGREAVKCFAAAACDLVFMDLEMPGMDGYEATRAIRSLEEERGGPAVPILALTAHALDEHRQRCLEAGCTDFLVKPIRKAALFSALARYSGAATPEAGATPSAGCRPDTERLRPLLPLFFETAAMAVEAGRQALAAGDLESARRQGHRLKGSARSYGFEELGRAAELLERAALELNPLAAGTALEWAATLLAKARIDSA